MNIPTSPTCASTSCPHTGYGHRLQFRSLSDPQRGHSFSCDAQGRVDLDSFCERERNNYFYARVLIGHDFSVPIVRHGSQQCSVCADRPKGPSPSARPDCAPVARR